MVGTRCDEIRKLKRKNLEVCRSYMIYREGFLVFIIPLKDVAAELGVSVQTVKSYARQIRRQTK